MTHRLVVVATMLTVVAAACGSTTSVEPPTTTAAPSGTSDGGSTESPAVTTASSSTSGPAPSQCPTVTATPVPYELAESTEAAGLVTPLTGMHGHAAAWGDVDGDGFPDLFVGTFADRPPDVYAVRGASGPSPDRLLIGDGSSFGVDEGFSPELGRTSGAVFADLDADGDLDLVASRNAGRGEGARAEPTVIFRNDGGTLTAVDAGFDSQLGGRSVAVFDQDLDGLVDLLIVEDRFRGGSSRLYRNLGDLAFADVTEEVGLPADINGLGVAVGDVSGDGRADVFVSGSNRLFIADEGRFDEADSSVFQWETFGDEDILAGVDMADVDLDGRLDLVVGHHYNSTVDFDTEVAVRLYLNRSTADSVSFIDVTEAAGLTPLPTKAPHVEFADMDNDGLLDIVTSASAENGTVPAVFLGTGSVDDVPVFATPDGLGSDQYWVAAPTADYNRDGRLDLLAVEWEPSLGSLLFTGHNDGSWVSIGLADPALAPGSTVWVYESGALGDPDQLLAHRPLTASKGYTAGTELLVHVGLGARSAVDAVVVRGDGTRFEATQLASGSIHLLGGGC